MLQLKDIVKDYPAGSGTVHALKGISLDFRKSDFVSILGPSGCGKTTLLNIIGGLDQYTTGDLVINGVSTKAYKDRDWDTYRNHSIGFVFQTYNLIPHQNVLSNVELALTLSGVGKAERRRRAKEALEAVGLGDQLRKKPSEMSGGQMQRVAIARALVTNPDIILADEPTGALDTETSIQVMDILKEVSKDRLVIMVTHNPDLAERYSTRIINMLDGLITGDSRPVTPEEVAKMQAEGAAVLADSGKKRSGKPSMSLGTSFALSLKNLFSKKGRTILTAFAGSIGIIGIALILSVSEGTTAYINDVQEDTLTSYPITLERSTISLSSLMKTFMGREPSGEEELDQNRIFERSALFDMMSATSHLETEENDLASFKKFLEAKLEDDSSEKSLYDAISGIRYTYDLPLVVYTQNIDGGITHADTVEHLSNIMAKYMGMNYDTEAMGGNVLMNSYATNMSDSVNMWCEMLPGKDGSLVSDVLKDQYDLIYGSWPNDYDEIVLLVGKHNELDDLTLYAMGLISDDEIEEIMDDVDDDDERRQRKSWSFEEVCGRTYRVVFNSDCYSYDEKTGFYTDLRKSDAGMKYLYDNGMDLKISGIIRANEDASSSMLSGSIAYTSKLTEHIIEESRSSAAIDAQIADPSTDILTGLPFQENTGNLKDDVKADEFRSYIDGLSDSEKALKYVEIMSIPSEDFVAENVDNALFAMTREDKEDTMVTALVKQMGMDESTVLNYVQNMSDEDMDSIFEQMIGEQVKMQYAASVAEQMAMVPDEQKVMMLDMAMADYTDAECARYYDEILTFSDSTYDDNLLELGYVDINDPATINIYASSFENKDYIQSIIDEYNEGLDELEKIKYTDYVGIVLSSVTTIIDAITYVLIAFVAISLIVSSIMIGVITLISVQERTKEIGILRAIGASKKNVAGLFNAETLIIGFISGVIGVGVTVILCVPINLILRALTKIQALRAFLPWQAALILIAISMLLTLIAGIIPSKSAAKKDPVVALRTE